MRKKKLPEGLKHTEAVEFFNKISARYDLNDAGLELLKVAAFTLQRWREAQQALDRDGCVLSGSGISRINPLTKVEHDSRLSFCRMMKELGLEESHE